MFFLIELVCMEIIGVSNKEGIYVFKIKDIVYIESCERNTMFFFNNGQKIESTKNIGFYEDILRIQGFFRVHQSFLVNLSFIFKIHRNGGDYIEFAPKKMKLLPISRRKNEQLRKLLFI